MSSHAKKWALFSVTDKTGCEVLAKDFVSQGINIVSSGGTRKYLQEHGLEVMDISEFTGEPERFGGRVKTLHHKIYSSLLLRADNKSDWQEWPEGHQIVAVACNFYPFEEKGPASKDMDEMIEWVDIGGPTMVRAAAKNSKNVWIFTNPSQYQSFLAMSEDTRQSEATRYQLAFEAFELVQRLDTAIMNEWGRRIRPQEGSWTFAPEMKYGENPHQKAQFAPLGHVDAAEYLGPVGFNNVRDAEGAWKFVQAFADDQAAVAVVKHQTLCGASVAPKLSNKEEAFQWAWEGDTVSRFGGIVAFNHLTGDEATACLKKNFVEVVVLPKTDECREWAEQLHANKPRCRFVLVGKDPQGFKETYQGRLGRLSQDADFEEISRDNFWKTVSAWMGACSKSNALALTLETDSGTIVLAGAGQGQPNRVEAFARLAWPRAQDFLNRFPQFTPKDLLLYSDAFLPFPDLIDAMSEAKVMKLVQPGGSKNDEVVFARAKELGVECDVTGTRHFWH